MRLLTAGSLVRVQLGEPRRSKLCIACSDFFQKSERAHVAAPPFQTGPAAAGLRFGFWGMPQVLYRHSYRVGAKSLCSGLFLSSENAYFPPAPLLLLCAKGHARLACSVASVLATARCRYQPFAGSSPTLKDGMAYLLPPIYASEQNPFAPAYFYLRKMHIFRPRLCSAPLILKFFFNHIRSTNTVAILDNMDYFVLLFYSKDVWWCALCQ